MDKNSYSSKQSESHVFVNVLSLEIKLRIWNGQKTGKKENNEKVKDLRELHILDTAEPCSSC